MRIGYQQQVLLAGAVLLASTLLVAALLNEGSTWWSARSELMRTAQQVDRRSMQVRAESLAMAMSLPDDEGCDLAQLRQLLAQAHHVRNIGKIRGTHVYCDALDGERASIELGPADVTRRDGIRAWVGKQGVWAARGHSVLVMDPASFLDTPMPPHTVVSILEVESGRRMISSGALPRSLELAAWKAGHGSFTAEDHLVAVSKSSDGRTLEVAARPLAAVRAASDKTSSRFLSAGAVAGLGLSVLAALAIRHRRSLKYELRNALRQRLLHVALQPIVGFDHGGPRVVGFECLARWQTASGEEISPDRFVPMIESLGLGAELARCMVANLVREFGATLVANPHLYVAFNLSSADVADPKLLDDIDRTLAGAGIPTSQVVIELTERTFEAEGLEQGLERLRTAGHRLSIDDFGTGASNASRLASFHPEMVKVDRSFLVHADGEGKAAALLPQLVAMAHSCGAKVVIEGVETVAQAKSLAGYGEVFAQGYFWHRPMGSGEAMRLVEEELDVRGLLDGLPRPDVAAPIG